MSPEPFTPPIDVRAYYAALGIGLPPAPGANAPVRCFADPATHAHADHNPSCSVNLDTGAWCCHGCGAHGGAYDAAIARGHTPRSAIDLLIDHGLTTQRRPCIPINHRTAPTRRRRRRASAPAPAAALRITDADVAGWCRVLAGDAGAGLRRRLGSERGWPASVLAELELGYDGQRLTIPIRSADGSLQGLLRYRLGDTGPKMLAAPGSRLGLIPHPAREPATDVLLVEGPPDMLAARSRGRAAIAVPGAQAWQTAWAPLLANRAVTIVMDCDDAGRQAARRIADDLRPLAAVRVIDLAPRRHDGYDLTDWVLSHPPRRSHPCNASSSPKPTIRP